MNQTDKNLKAMGKQNLSVIIPNYNHARYLPRCLDAVIEQSVQPSEILVIDDGSTDDSIRVIESYARRFSHLRLVRNELNQGVVPTINRGLQIAASEYVYFSAADDFILPGFFEKSLALLSQHSQAALCCSIGKWRDVTTETFRVAGDTMAETACYLSPDRMVELEKQGRLLIGSQTVIIKKDALLKAGQFIPELRWHCDWFANYVAGFRDGVCFVPESLAVFNVTPGSYGKSGMGRKQAHRQVLRHMIERLEIRENRDVAELIRRGGALYRFGKPVLMIVLGNPRFWHYLTPAFLRKTLAVMAQSEKKKWRRSLHKALGRWRGKT